MKTYIVKYDTNYGMGIIVINTAKGIDYAKELADKSGAWDGFEIEELNTKDEGLVYSECS
jgi:hypothetical protein